MQTCALSLQNAHSGQKHSGIFECRPTVPVLVLAAQLELAAIDTGSSSSHLPLQEGQSATHLTIVHHASWTKCKCHTQHVYRIGYTAARLYVNICH